MGLKQSTYQFTIQCGISNKMATFTGSELCTLHVKGENCDYELFNVVLHGTIQQCLMYMDEQWLSSELSEEQEEDDAWTFNYDKAIQTIMGDMVFENDLWSLVVLIVEGHEPIVLRSIDDVVHVHL